MISFSNMYLNALPQSHKVITKIVLLIWLAAKSPFLIISYDVFPECSRKTIDAMNTETKKNRGNTHGIHKTLKKYIYIAAH